jgi:hypothetical protein
MKKLLGPTGTGLVGATFICLLILLPAIADQTLPDLDAGLKESLSSAGDNAFAFPGAKQSHFSLSPSQSRLFLSSLPSEEKIAMNATHSSEQLGNLLAINSVKQRDVVCEETQNSDTDGQEFSNSLDLRVSGPGQGRDAWSDEDYNDLEKIVDDAFPAFMKNDSENERTAVRDREIGNNMNIEVSGIYVSALNTVEGGSAVATSNIIIKPSQIIIYPSEVEEKLK